MDPKLTLSTLLTDINVATGQQEVKAIEDQCREILEEQPPLLLEVYLEMERWSPVVLESLVDLAGVFHSKGVEVEAMEAILEPCSHHPRGWVRTKAAAHLGRKGVHVGAYRNGDRIFRNLLMPEMDLSCESLEALPGVELLYGKSSDWGDSLLARFQCEGHLGAYAHLTMEHGRDHIDEEGHPHPFDWLSMGILSLEPTSDPLGDGSIPSNDQELFDTIESWKQPEGSWLFHVEGSLTTTWCLDLHVQDPGSSLADRLTLVD